MSKHPFKRIEFLTLRKSNLNNQIFNTDLKGNVLFSCFIYFWKTFLLQECKVSGPTLLGRNIAEQEHGEPRHLQCPEIKLPPPFRVIREGSVGLTTQTAKGCPGGNESFSAYSGIWALASFILMLLDLNAFLKGEQLLVHSLKHLKKNWKLGVFRTLQSQLLCHFLFLVVISAWNQQICAVPCRGHFIDLETYKENRREVQNFRDQ